MSQSFLSKVILATALLLPQLFCELQQREIQEEAPATDEAIEKVLSQGMELAKQWEPILTETLGQLAERHQGALFGLEHRFKQPDSLRRKLRDLAETSTNPLTLSSIDDLLRYTIRIDDDPAGHHVRSAREILDTLEELGFTIIAVKNYWPRGDDYSGINTVLRTPDGFRWELQFHTPDSLAAEKEGHILYERMRRADTPVDEQRRLFDELADQWEGVPVPDQVLDPQSLHELEVITSHPRP